MAIAPRDPQLCMAGVWVAAIVSMGGVWFVRNLIALGNPIPAAKIDLGVLSLPSPPLTKLTFALPHYVGKEGVWGDRFLPGLLEAYGPLWWALIALALAGMVAAVTRGPGRVERMLGVRGAA